MKRILFYICICYLASALISCTDQTSYKTVSLFINETSHLITLTGYKNGNVDPLSYQVIQMNETKEIYVDQNDGKGRGLVYPGEMAGLDSLVVLFDNSKKAVHYGPLTQSGNNPLALDYNNGRNLFNEDNWNLKTLKDTRRRLESEFSYTFTEQDYMDTN